MNEKGWSREDYLLVVLFPIFIFAGIVAKKFITNSPLLLSSVGFILSSLIFGLVIYFRRNLLREDWGKFKEHRLRNWGYIVLAVIVFEIMQTITSKVPNVASIQVLPITSSNTLGILMGAVGSIMAPFSEEVIFRHELVYKFRNSNILTLIGMIVFSALFFGLGHFISGDRLNSLLALSLTGLVLSLIYLHVKNIWVTIFAHFIWNFFLSATVLAVYILQVPAGR
ncbi:CPBP family intramembrane metalloprotease [Weissella muntiaci]|uniref:CPBP family intramembrane metalloprotease n=1 Tax=Weissella muntiaci TaxID=2508881 RepID=A0A6C2C9J2_9LACO|nr:type II CAAX endopeptidase family protein [Weissella muntiaci]TYC50537.1 CPBP family intramembrane metalloprotease [Weissella muntiaci]